jgi:3-polyprenyl-4-hydroxybenzoate decarboxylase
MRRFIVGMTGSSGACYGVRLVELLARSGAEVHLIVTTAGRTVLAQEAAAASRAPWTLLTPCGRYAAVQRRICPYPIDDGAAPRPAAPGDTTAWSSARAR